MTATSHQQHELQRSFPEAVDLLAICVAAGASLPAAIASVADNATGLIGTEFQRIAADLEVGQSLSEALTSFRERYPVTEVQSFVGTLIQAHDLGLPVSDVLWTQAAHARDMRRLRITEQAHRIPILVLFPLVLCLLPALIAIVVGPAVLTILDQMGS